jgi:YCII-related domain
MEDFALLFRQPVMDEQVSQCDMQYIFNKWDNWFSGIAAQGKLNNMGINLANPGKVLRAGGIITDGPFVEIRERLNGFIVVKAENIDEAITLAHGCPILEVNGTVEIRPFRVSDQWQSHLLSRKSPLQT